jgi:GR25 family glycosyltransferase involved in LPS biosynthesis
MKTYIIHVSTAYEREEHIKKQIAKQNLEGTFINFGDIKDLSNDIFEQYFEGGMKQAKPATSCAYKHLLAYEAMIQQQDALALILEDDIILHHNFASQIAQIAGEIKASQLQNILVSLEDSELRFVKGSQLRPNQYLYPNTTGRTAGAYLLDLKGAESIVHEARTQKCSLPIDWFHNLCVERNKLAIYWAHPTIATQGSLLGSIKSMIDNKPAHLLRILSFRLQRWYKKILYRFR